MFKVNEFIVDCQASVDSFLFRRVFFYLILILSSHGSFYCICLLGMDVGGLGTGLLLHDFQDF